MPADIGCDESVKHAVLRSEATGSEKPILLHHLSYQDSSTRLFVIPTILLQGKLEYRGMGVHTFIATLVGRIGMLGDLTGMRMHWSR